MLFGQTRAPERTVYQSPEWRRHKTAFRRWWETNAGEWACVSCGVADGLHTHHLQYNAGFDQDDVRRLLVPFEWLRPVCSTEHDVITSLHRQPRVTPLAASRRVLGDDALGIEPPTWRDRLGRFVAWLVARGGATLGVAAILFVASMALSPATSDVAGRFGACVAGGVSAVAVWRVRHGRDVGWIVATLAVLAQVTVVVVVILAVRMAL